MNAPRSTALVLAAALAFVACGGGDDKGATTTSSAAGDTSSTSFEPTTTTIDPALQDLLLVAADLKDFKEKTPREPDDPNETHSPTCRDPAVAPAGTALDSDPYVNGATFVRGPDDDVDVSSSVTDTTPEKAEAALKEVLDPEVVECLEKDLRAESEKGLPAGTTLTFKTTPSESTVAGTDQAVLVTSTASGKTADGSPFSLRIDLVFLRKAGIILTISYIGPGNLTTSAERQRIVAIAAKKLAGDSGTSTTSAAGGGSTSSIRGSTTTRRSSSTTRQGGSTSSSRRSTTSTTSTTR